MSFPLYFMFSGQGSHYYQMGRYYFEQNAVFRRSLLKTDEVCMDLLGKSVVQALYDPQVKISTPCVDVCLTHPAIFMVEYAFCEMLHAEGILPDAVLGASLGEISAATIAGVLNVTDALQLIIHQAKTLQRYCETGSMLAILASPTLFHENAELNQASELAAVNFAEHFVVSGTVPAIQKIITWLQAKKIVSQLLPVTVPFHSALLDSVKELLLYPPVAMQFALPTIPCISCMEVAWVKEMTPTYWWASIRQPILFEQTIAMLETQQNAIYLDVGPSGTLANFVKYNLSNTSASKYAAVCTPFGQDASQSLVALKNIINKIKT